MRSLQSLLLVVVAVGALASLSMFTVQEYEMALISEFGRLRTDKSGKALVVGPGLHFKKPFIEKIHRLDKRLQTLSIQPTRKNNTLDKKVLLVDLFVQWKIENFELLFVRTEGNRARIESLLRQKAMNSLARELGKRTLKHVIAEQRDDLMTAVELGTDKSASSSLGIRVTDVRIKRIDLPQQVSQSVFARMNSERESIARQYRADGRSEAEKIKASADKEARIILATSKKDAEALRGEGDALAIETYSALYNESKEAIEFYDFHRSLEAYRHVFRDKKDLLLLKPDGAFFKYFMPQGINSKE